MGNEDGSIGEKFNFANQKPLGSCPKCGGSVFEYGNQFICEKLSSHRRMGKNLAASFSPRPC